jgi:hypothetical protein
VRNDRERLLDVVETYDNLARYVVAGGRERPALRDAPVVRGRALAILAELEHSWATKERQPV